MLPNAAMPVGVIAASEPPASTTSAFPIGVPLSSTTISLLPSGSWIVSV